MDHRYSEEQDDRPHLQVRPRVAAHLFPSLRLKAILENSIKKFRQGYCHIRSIRASRVQTEVPEGSTRGLLSPDLPVQEDSEPEDSELENPTEANHNVPYVRNGHLKQKLNLYLPSLGHRKNELTPVILYIPYTHCTRHQETPESIRTVVQDVGDFALVFVGYRDDDLPTAIYDCKAAVR